RSRPRAGPRGVSPRRRRVRRRSLVRRIDRTHGSAVRGSSGDGDVAASHLRAGRRDGSTPGPRPQHVDWARTRHERVPHGCGAHRETLARMRGRMNAPLIQLVALSLWLGASAFFSFVVAPALFATLPSRTMAGAVVGRTLPIVFYLGIAAGAIVIALQASDGRSALRDARALCACLVVAACAVSQFIIRRRIDRVREAIGGPIESLAAGDPRRVAFGRLHGLSVAWLGVAMLAAAAALVLAWRANATATSNH